MTVTASDQVQAGERPEGYREFAPAASLPPRRVLRPRHVADRHATISIDAFLRALQRDVAWDFFYGTVNFDHVIGTVNHYGNVDLFAGRYNDAYRKAELDHVENYETPLIRETFKAMLDDWTNGASTRSPAPPRPKAACKQGSNTEAVTRQRVTASAWSASPATRRSAATRWASRSTACSPTSPGRTGDRGRARLRGGGVRVQPVRLPVAANVTWNPSVVSVCKDSLYCPTTEEYILPIIHGNDRVEWFVQLSDEIEWDAGSRHRRRRR